MIRWSQFFLPTLRDVPKETEAVSHRLLLRAGLVRQIGSGAYAYLPLGLRVLSKVERILREELAAAGAQELLLPALHPPELWQATGRYELMRDVLFKVKDRHGKELLFGPTHEEVITSLVAGEVKSYKQLPLILYQIQTKFRDEPRPRFGIIRTKEFVMKDAYSFDVDEAGLERSYRAMYAAYERIFRRCDITVRICEADTGVMGGSGSHEFMAPAAAGEDFVAYCAACGYAASLEIARAAEPAAVSLQPSAFSKAEAVATPGKHTVEEVSAFLNVPAARLLKTLLYDSDRGPLAVVIPGDRQVSEPKLLRAAGAKRLQLADARTIERLTGAPLGFSGPVGLRDVPLFVDQRVLALHDLVAGANQAETHLVHVEPGRDFQPTHTGDLCAVIAGELCPTCRQPLALDRTIEAGHVFKLGTRYSAALHALFQGEDGQARPMIMGCYGIGVNRIIACAIEQHQDQDGIIWPRALAPFDVLVTVLDVEDEVLRRQAEAVASACEAAGYEVLLDDRALSAGVKLKDADLIGIPRRVVVGKKSLATGCVEVSLRATRAAERVPPASVGPWLEKALDTPTVST